MTPIAPHITAFLQVRLPVERRASAHTCDTYAYAFQLLFEFASQRLGVPPSALQLEQIDAALVLAFLEHLQKDRGNGSRTRNARLAAIKSFMRFVEHRVPSALEQIRRVLAIPSQRTEGRIVRHLTVPEQRALLDVPDPTTRRGSATAPSATLPSLAACACRNSSAFASRTSRSAIATSTCPCWARAASSVSRRCGRRSPTAFAPGWPCGERPASPRSS